MSRIRFYADKYIIQHEFEYGSGDISGKLKCVHCKKDHYECLNRDGSFNSKCKKRLEPLD
jgi:hypothetical protein